MNTEKKLIPLLRFPEYTYANSFWLENNVGDSIKTLSPPKKLQSNDYKRSGKYPIIDQSQGFICGYSDDNSAVINKNSKELIVFGDHTCVLKFIDFPFIQGADGIKIFEPKDAAEVDVRYLYQYLVSSQIESKEYKRHFSELKEKLFLYPKTINEQTKIADCLFAIDSYISSINEKVEKLKAHKKSLLQKLFPQKGKTLPEYRFPEFAKEGIWTIKRMGECFTERIERNHEDLPLLSLTEDEGIVLQENINRKNNSNSDKSKYLHVCIDDIVYNTMRMWQGRCALVGIEGIVSPAYTVCCPKSNVCSLFFYYLFKTKNAIEVFHKHSQGLVNDTLNMKYENFEKISFCVPNYEEQKIIATFLSSIDHLIMIISNKILLLERHKKGLMQQLFPQI